MWPVSVPPRDGSRFQRRLQVLASGSGRGGGNGTSVPASVGGSSCDGAGGGDTPALSVTTAGEEVPAAAAATGVAAAAAARDASSDGVAPASSGRPRATVSGVAPERVGGAGALV